MFEGREATPRFKVNYRRTVTSQECLPEAPSKKLLSPFHPCLDLSFIYLCYIFLFFSLFRSHQLKLRHKVGTITLKLGTYPSQRFVCFEEHFPFLKPTPSPHVNVTWPSLQGAAPVPYFWMAEHVITVKSQQCLCKEPTQADCPLSWTLILCRSCFLRVYYSQSDSWVPFHLLTSVQQSGTSLHFPEATLDFQLL